jgi:hypothetical protein
MIWLKRPTVGLPDSLAQRSGPSRRSRIEEAGLMFELLTDYTFLVVLGGASLVGAGQRRLGELCCFT